MEYIIKRKNHIIAQIRPEGQLQTSIMGEELVTMTFSLGQYIRFQTGDSVEVYGNLFYLASEPQVEKISTREFRYSLEFQGVKYELSKVQYLFPDAQNVLNLSEFHIMGTARQMLDLLVQNANRIGAGWSLGSIDTTETKQLHFSSENCLAVLSKIAQEFQLEYWVDANKSIHLTERKAVSGYSFEYGKSKGLVSLTRETQQGSNIITRLYAFGSEKNIAGNYRNGQKNLRMAVPYLEKNTDIYGIIEGSQTFDVYPHRIGKVTAINPNNPLQFTDNQLDFDLNEKENGNHKYLINGVSVKVTFNTGQLAGYSFEVKEFGYHSATKTFTLLKNTDEKAMEVPSEMLRPAVGDTYVLTDLIMPQKYIANAEAELQRKAQAYLNENSRERVIYSLVTDPLYFTEQNVDLQLGSTIFIKDTDFNLEENLRIIRLVKDLQNPYKVQVEVAERAEIAHIVREYLQEEKAKTALLQADKFNAEIAKKAYRFGREIHDNIFDGEGYFNTEKIKPLSIDTKHISVGSRMQQFALPDVMISVENATTIKNTRGKIVHFSLEENLREWHIPANTQTGISAGFHYIYIKAQRNGNNASVWVSSEKIAVESDPNFYHFEAGYLGSVEGSNRRIRLSHGFTQISPHEITTGRISSQDGSQYIDLLQDKIKIVADVQFSAENKKEILEGIQIGGRNLILNSSVRKENGNYQIAEYRLSQKNQYINGEEYTITVWGNLNASKTHFSVFNSGGMIKLCDLKKVSQGVYKATFIWNNSIVTGNGKTHTANNSTLQIYQMPNGSGVSSIEKIKLEKGNYATDWSPAPEDIDAQISISESAIKAYADAQDLLQKTLLEAHTDGKVTEAEKRQIALAENKLKEAKNHATQAVNNLQIGGRNLILNSSVRKETNNFLLSEYRLSQNHTYKNGEEYTITLWGNLSSQKTHIEIYNSSGSVLLLKCQKIAEGIYGGTFRWNDSHPFKVNNTFLQIYQMPNGVVGLSSIEKIKLEKGNKATDWTPAPEDIDQKISTLKEKTDFFNNTKIKGNFITSQTLEMGNSEGAEAGITGEGLENDAVRFWAGASFENRGKAPFRVLDNGTLHAENAHIKGKIEATSGRIGTDKGFGIKIQENGEVSIGFEQGFDGVGEFNEFKISKEGISIAGKGMEYHLNEKAFYYGKSTPSGDFSTSIKGGAIFKDVYSGSALSNTIIKHLAFTDTFIFIEAGNVTLPNQTQMFEIMESYFSAFERTTEIKIINASGNRISIMGVPNGVIVNNQGAINQGGNGSITLNNGNVLTLLYYDKRYFITNFRS